MSERLKNSYYNVILEIIYFILNTIINLVLRKVIIKLIGVEVAAINYLLNQIVNSFTIIEFGIFNIMLFHLYSALKDDNHDKINDIMSWFRKIYIFIALIIMAIGIVFIPSLKYFINDYHLSINYIFIYLLILIQSSTTFIFSYKMYLLQAEQKTYLYLRIMVLFKIVTFIIELLLLFIFKNYYIYLISFVINNLLMYYTISKYVDRKYQYLNDNKPLKKKYSKSIKKHIKSTGISKICSTLNQGMDAFLLGILSNVKTLGLYSNYVLIISPIYYVIQKIFDSFKASIGNIIINENNDTTYRVFKNMCTCSYILGFISSILFYVLIEYIIKIWLGKEFLLSNVIAFIFSIQLFTFVFRISLWQFTYIKGWFEISKISDLIGLLINFILSILLYYKIGLAGIIMGTIISQIVQYFIELYMILKRLKQNITKFIIKQIINIILYLIALTIVKYYYLLSIPILLSIILYTGYLIKRSDYCVFKNKKIN